MNSLSVANTVLVAVPIVITFVWFSIWRSDRKIVINDSGEGEQICPKCQRPL